MQHYRLERDIEIAVVDGERGFGNNCLLPAGPLREPVSRLNNVDFVITQQQTLANNTMVLSGNKLIRMTDQKEIKISDLNKSSVHAVAGVGNPSRFFASLRKAGLRIIEHVFPDHYAYRKEDLDFKDVFPIIMTEKDAVKCETFVNERFWYLPVIAEVDKGFASALLKKIGEKNEKI